MDLLKIEEFWTKFESQRQLVSENLTVTFNFDSMSVLELTEGLSIFLLGLKKIFVPLLIEFLVLLDVCLFALLSLLCLIENKFLISSVVVLLFKLLDSILCHFCLNILAFSLACFSVIFKDLTVVEIKRVCKKIWNSKITGKMR